MTARPPIPTAGWPAGRIAAWIARQVEVGLTETDISLPQYRVLGLLNEGNSLPSSMADRLDVRRPSITAVVDGLVAKGLVVRTPAEGDRRQIDHCITPAGVKTLLAADSAVGQRLSGIAACLETPQETDDAMAAIDLWGKALWSWRERQRASSSMAEPAGVPAPTAPERKLKAGAR